ncbi:MULTISPECIES: ParA family protein [unclassified Nitratiruptor]|uniref:ParA family protein n=1 Tax=unclassified Nitratiruptor TaxID=2624044 RepID=UPI0018EC1391|nr:MULTISPECIES: ParA family protein [unclassified Nitratiruptor]BCD61144.1 chromosome partitioning protein [Nitratiruptor sp. YY08-10]BCD65077.1 chromosome partitioning protein [Nitratiruptor sp. YY08-14]
MKNITIANFKGGVGKSLIAHQLITCFDYKGVEIDPYGSLYERLPEKVIKVDVKEKKLPKTPERSAFDFGGFDDIKLDQAIERSNLVIIPFIPTLESVQGTLDTLNRVKEHSKPILMVANMVQKPEDVNDAKFVFEEVLGFDVEVFQMPISVALQTAINENKGITELAKQGGIRAFAYKKAKKVIEDLYKVINNYL